MSKQKSSFGKLERARAKQARAKSKKERRAARDLGDVEERPVNPRPRQDESQILEMLAELQRAFDDGRMSLDDFESRRDDLRDQLTVD